MHNQGIKLTGKAGGAKNVSLALTLQIENKVMQAVLPTSLYPIRYT